MYILLIPLAALTPIKGEQGAMLSSNNLGVEFHHEEKCFLHGDFVRAKHVSRKGWEPWAERGKQQVNWLDRKSVV